MTCRETHIELYEDWGGSAATVPVLCGCPGGLDYECYAKPKSNDTTCTACILLYLAKEQE